MTQETRVGYMTTSILEDMLFDYIKSSVKEGKYTGDVHYLLIYDKIKQYNRREDKRKW